MSRQRASSNITVKVSMKAVTRRKNRKLYQNQAERMVAWGLVTTVNWRKVLKLEPMQFLDTMGMCTKNDLSQLQLYTVVI